MTAIDTPTSTPAQTVGRPLATVLGLLTIFGPISMDLYLPVLPALTAELQSTTSVAQLTITACLLGLAIGQVIAGPVSDRFGRRTPLLIGVIAYTVTSALCALSPTVETLIVARFVQGLAGAVGIVIAQAAGRDVYSGGKLLRYYGRLTVLGGVAAIIGPVIGGQLATVTDWRGVFHFLAAVGVAILGASLVIFRETLPANRRTTGGLSHTLSDFRRLLADRVFVGAVLITGFTYAAIFAYLSGATYILQGVYGLSPQGYSFAFGLNSLGF
ncbi:multidrug effflux MFS transporter [Arthrobacter sp. ISL-69]|uniref:multidrug effflux MFS transporter n=1 Tax=Arthrobacter sp. ISL-69 TaxID=2819113 RepID=UPI00288A0F23|nr:multidrug effflux MFS transporter [Arthrobacter sp. ISL-69]